MPISKIIVPITGRLDATEALDMAAVAGRLLYSHVEALYIRPNTLQALQVATGYEPLDWVEENAQLIEQQAQRSCAVAHEAFLRWAERQGVELAAASGPRTWDVTAGWREWAGTPETAIADLGRFADLIVLARPDAASEDRRMAQIKLALFDAGRPVLVAPPQPPEHLGRSAMIAWNASREALHALTGALPLLSRMHRVVVLTIGETQHANPVRDEELLDYLACHGLKPERVNLEPSRQGAGAHLLHEAAAMGADLLVMGGYTHSRMREAILGGATRHVLEHAELPVLLAH